MLTQERLKEVLEYNPETGIFIWLLTRGKTKVGKRAGRIHHSGYRRINIDGQEFREHRLAFLYMEGSFPEYEVDHDNRIKSDNKWDNLLPCTRSQNMQNTKVNVAFLGVHYLERDNRWRVKTPKINGKDKIIGYYKTHLAACYRRWNYDCLGF